MFLKSDLLQFLSAMKGTGEVRSIKGSEIIATVSSRCPEMLAFLVGEQELARGFWEYLAVTEGNCWRRSLKVPHLCLASPASCWDELMWEPEEGSDQQEPVCSSIYFYQSTHG